MVHMLDSIKRIPHWLKVVILAMQGLFFFAVGITLQEFYSDHQRHLAYERATQQQKLYRNSITRLGEFRGLCTLARIEPIPSSELIQLCESASINLVEALEAMDYPAAEIDQILSVDGQYYEIFLRKSAYSEQLLTELFQIYRDSGVQLEENILSYTAGRTIFVHLPDLIEKMGVVRGITGLSNSGLVSRNNLYIAEGRVTEILSNTRNTLEAFEQANASSSPSELLLDFEIIEQHIVEHFERLYRYRFMELRDPTKDYDLDLFLKATEVLDEIEQLYDVTEETYISLLASEHDRTDQLTGLSILFALVTQFLLILMFRFMLRAIHQIEETSEQAMQASSSLAKTLKQQDKMFAIIGHELRTPAAALNMQLNELQLQDGQNRRVEEAHATSQHLLDVLDDMRVGTDKSLITESRVETQLSVYRIIKEASHTLYYTANQYGVDIQVRGNSDGNHIGFKKQIRQIIINMTKNAIVHSQGTQVTLDLSHKASEEETEYRLQIIDNGKGIPDKDVDRLFEAFERGDTKASGTGLGLHISRELARSLSNGDLVFSPNPEGGAIFTLSFTLKQAKHEEAAAAAAKEHAIKGQKILLVEDTATLRMLGKTILTREGAEVVDVENGQLALDAYSKQSFDLIITDIMMPIMDGYELTETLRSWGATLPIIGVTGATVGNEADNLLAKGADRVLPKPLNLDQLETALEEIEAN
ncbi:hybrid sensor histidine kinase/response regulator [Marinobacterium sp. xm-d-530]|uniref:ATP-binding response regulator n=1 Tax=Marinobacterium sp. xm-d-530 TaxID=2497747 RepID=UPI001567DB0A|nr:hybrid sensor histidine kinase/response regulator [Marinobacterium sp. xm-d-530]NRQ01332.1 Sensor protein EvgS precursor [Marinobacterium sp. xm-d-530]